MTFASTGPCTQGSAIHVSAGRHAMHQTVEVRDQGCQCDDGPPGNPRTPSADGDFAASRLASPLQTMPFARHRQQRGAVTEFRGQRGRVVTSSMQSGPVDADMQTKLHDPHGHLGPGYSPTQVYDFASPSRESMLHQLRLMDEAGVDEIFDMGIPTNIAGGEHACGGDDELEPGRTYYLPDEIRDNLVRLTPEVLAELARVQQYYNTSVDWQIAKAWASLGPEERARIHLCITGVSLADPHGVFSAMTLKLEYPDAFHWMGEVTGAKEVVGLQNCCYRPSVEDTAALQKYLSFCGRAGMGLTLHYDVSDARAGLRSGKPGQSENLPGLRKLFARHPRTVIVWAHMGLGKYSPPSPRHEDDLRELLEACPKLHVDMSWDAVATHYSPDPKPALNLTRRQLAAFDPVADATLRKERIARLAEVIKDFPDRFLYGSDALVPRKPDPFTSAYAIYSGFGQGPGKAGAKALFDHLGPDVLDRLLHRNFTRLHTDARAASRHYEADAMRHEMQAIQRKTIANNRTPNHWKPLG